MDASEGVWEAHKIRSHFRLLPQMAFGFDIWFCKGATGKGTREAALRVAKVD